MEIGNDDLDFITDDYGNDLTENTTTQDNIDQEDVGVIEDGDNLYNQSNFNDDQQNSDEDDFITELLKTRGIEDKSRIKFENDEGEVEEVDWESLSNNDKLNILSSSQDIVNELDDQEFNLINAIRQSQLSPSEYLQALQRQSVNAYIQNTQDQALSYKVDEINDEELYISDLLSRTPGMTETEAYESLDRIKQNEALFKKQIGAIRNEYKNAENEALRYQEAMRQQEAQEQYNLFADSVANSISNFTEFSGCDINMNQEDMQDLYDFITEVDATGVTHFGKVLNDPEWLVKVAWFALNGEQMINDISEYYKKEIANVRKESYNKGLQAAKDKPSVVHKTVHPTKKSNSFDDLDDF